jgi:hypothetical protein
LANGMQMGKLAKPMQPLSNKMWQLWHCSRHLIFRPWRSRPPPFLLFLGFRGCRWLKFLIARGDLKRRLRQQTPSPALQKPSRVLFFSLHFWLAEPTWPDQERAWN